MRTPHNSHNPCDSFHNSPCITQPIFGTTRRGPEDTRTPSGVGEQWIPDGGQSWNLGYRLCAPKPLLVVQQDDNQRGAGPCIDGFGPRSRVPKSPRPDAILACSCVTTGCCLGQARECHSWTVIGRSAEARMTKLEQRRSASNRCEKCQ